MEKATKSNILSIIKEFKRIIKLNSYKIPSSDLYDHLGEVAEGVNNDKYNLNYTYTDILAQFSEIINNCNTDDKQINKSILNQINEHYKLSNASCSDEDSDEDSDGDEDGHDDEDGDNEKDNSSDKENYKSDERNTDNNEENISNILSYDKVLNNLNEVLEKSKNE